MYFEEFLRWSLIQPGQDIIGMAGTNLENALSRDELLISALHYSYRLKILSFVDSDDS